MKNKLIIIILGISLMSTKCAEKSLNVIFQNNSDRNIVLSCTKNSDSLKNIILEKSYHDPRFKLLTQNSTKIDSFPESWLHFYSDMKERDYCTFYFLRIVKYDTLINNYVFEKKYDSINVDKEKILVEEEGKNFFIYGNKMVLFTSKINN